MPEPAYLIVVTGEGDRPAGQALAHPGQRPGRIAGAVPVAGHHRRGDANADQDLPAWSQGLQAGGRHGQQRRGTDLHRKHASAQPQDLARDAIPRQARSRQPHVSRPAPSPSRLVGPSCRLQPAHWSNVPAGAGRSLGRKGSGRVHGRDLRIRSGSALNASIPVTSATHNDPYPRRSARLARSRTAAGPERMNGAAVTPSEPPPASATGTAAGFAVSMTATIRPPAADVWQESDRAFVLVDKAGEVQLAEALGV